MQLLLVSAIIAFIIWQLKYSLVSSDQGLNSSMNAKVKYLVLNPIGKNGRVLVISLIFRILEYGFFSPAETVKFTQMLLFS